MWFTKLTGCEETSPREVRSRLAVEGNILKSRINGKAWTCGELTTPSLDELKKNVQAIDYKKAPLRLREIVANVQELHTDKSNAGSLFQVASQFNPLEMALPWITPEEGLNIYDMDITQGPTCAIAAGAGTIYRNYFVPVNGRTGQSRDNQIDCIAEIGLTLGNLDNHLWTMSNGYLMPEENGLAEITEKLAGLKKEKPNEPGNLLRIGIQKNTEVTIMEAGHLVTQAYCSALPVAYSSCPSDLWEPFARLILQSAYEATICAGIINSLETGNNRVYLTLLGGGVFGNKMEWIIDAICHALNRYRDANLEVAIVSHRSSNVDIQHLVAEFNQQLLR